MGDEEQQAVASNAAETEAEDGENEPAKPAYNDEYYLNDQTTLLCEMISIRDPIRVILEKRGMSSLIAQSTTQLYNDLLDENDDADDDKSGQD